MPGFEAALALLVVVALLAAASERLAIPYPILLVIGGIGLGLILAAFPQVPAIVLAPDLVLVVFLPPLVFAAAWETPIRDVRQNLRPVLLLSVGLVLFTTLVVGGAAALALPGIPLAAALALGAIVSPSDALAATTVLGKVPVPRRVRAILEEESLLNDATALVTYRTAVTAAVSGAFVVSTAIGSFILAALGGILVGLAVAIATSALLDNLDDPPVEVTISLVVPYAAYLPAEHLGASGVIAAVTAGLVLGRRSSTMFGSETRVLAASTWQILEFVLNGVAFLLVGIEMPAVLRSLGSPIGYEIVVATIAVTAAAILARVAWVFGTLYLPSRAAGAVVGIEMGDERGRVALVVSWAGMRGAISLAAALALPADFPDRSVILLLTSAVIAVTLLGQGLSLGWLLRRLQLPDAGDELEEETLARTRSVEAGLAKLEELRRAWPSHGPLIENLTDRYHHRLDHLPEVDESGELSLDSAREQERNEHRAILHALVGAERDAVIALRDDGDIGDEILRQVERSLDLEELRLDSLA